MASGGSPPNAETTADELFERVVWRYRAAVPLLFAVAAYVSAKKALYKRLDRVPRTNFLLFDGLSLNSRRVKDGAARWPALDACYNFTRGEGSNAVACEMMGMIDYLRDATIILLFRKISRHLGAGGYFFTCHIHPNVEAYFLRQVVNWEMSYRSCGKLRKLIEKGGFPNYRLLTEPHGIHSVAVARKI